MRHSMVLAALAVPALLAGCGGEREKAADVGKVRIVATIFPLADVVDQVGGDHVVVDCLLRPGMTPHGYRATAGDAMAAGRAQLLVRVGLGLDEWFPPEATNILVFADAAGVAGPAGATTEGRHAEAHAEESGADSDEKDAHHHHGGIDPHVWLDPVLMQRFVSKLADELARLDPAHKGDYLRRRDDYLARLVQLDEDYRRTLAEVKHKEFVTFHPAFTHITKRYGLRQESLNIAVGTAPGIGRMKEVTDFILAHGVKVVFAEPQFPADRLAALAREAGVKVGRLDPLGNPDVRGYDSYLGMMRSNLAALSDALKE